MKAAFLTTTLTLALLLASHAQDLVILNEYNAVSSSKSLKDGKADVFFGIATGNGGDWFELIVIADGMAGSTVDMRDWIIQIHETDGDAFDPTGTNAAGAQLGEVIRLTNDPFFEAVPGGTILTFTELNTSQGGLDTDLNKVDAFSDQGFGWSNVWIGDPTKVDVEASSGYAYIDGVVDDTNSVSIGGDDTQFRILNAEGKVIYDIAGEGIAPTGGVGSTEVYKLEANPSAEITVNDSNYTDGSSSSFGAPNVWSGGASKQSFAAFATGEANSAPTITSDKAAGEIRGFTSPEPFKIRFDDPDATDALTVSVTLADSETLPEWITLVANDDRTADLTFAPPADLDAGPVLLEISVSDGSLIATQAFTLSVFPDTSPIILNEYNAVAGGSWIGAEDADDDNEPDGTAGTDTFFGITRGNGGDWFELVVTGDGTPESTLDLRGWSIALAESGGVAEVITLSEEPYWATVKAGTILTFIENNTSDGGLDTHIQRVDLLSTEGYAWSNIWIRDTIYIDQAKSTLSDQYTINNNGMEFIIRDANGKIVGGPTGEDVGQAGNINSRSVLKLRETPSAENENLLFVTGLDGNYSGDDFSSSFGAPNQWSNDANAQDFAPYKAANSAAVFTSQPITVTSGDYRYDITAEDTDGSEAVSLTAEGLPDFLSLTDSALTTSRSLTPQDQGRYRIRLNAVDDAGSSTPQVFDLVVVNPQPTVILNEYNVVAPTKFLGDSKVEDAAEDVFFGKQLGNGGDWFELVVISDGVAGTTVDMRGWKIEIDREATDTFTPDNTLALSQDPYWAAVPVGTFLTFATERVLVSPEGKLNRTLDGSVIPAIDKQITDGFTWSHVWIGDSRYVTAPDESQGYRVADDEVTGIDINHLNTQFRIVGADGLSVFGPVGEGIAPAAGADDESIIEYEGQLVTGISPFSRSRDGTDVGGPGYEEGFDDGGGTGGSTFGQPNVWRDGTLQQFFDGRVPLLADGEPQYPIDGVTVNTPDWRTIITTSPAYDAWIAGFESLSDVEAFPFADPDGDGAPNEVEWVMGGDPITSDTSSLYSVTTEDGSTTLTYTTLDPMVEGITLSIEWSATLESGSWQEASPLWLSTNTSPVAGDPPVISTTHVIDPSQLEGTAAYLRFRVTQ